MTLLWGAGAGLYPLFSFALGLGDLQVQSRLNQPLRARIEVSDVSDEEWRFVSARVATQTSQADGLSKPGLLESVRFKTTEDANHRRFIEVQSAEVFTEPLFDLSIDVLGQDLQVTRNYTVFLDPPGPNNDLPGAQGPQLAKQALSPPKQSVVKGAEENQAATAGDGESPAPHRVVTAQGSEGGASQRKATGGRTTEGHKRAAVASTAGEAAPRSATADTASSAAAVYTVSKADTLERIARRYGGTNAASRNQFMQWVFQHNANAFYGDMDHLRAGVRLTLPGNAVAATGNTPAVPSVPVASNAKIGPMPLVAAGGTVAKEQLEGEVTSMQQELTGLQKMIAQQDAQIASLKQQVAAREEQQRVDESRSEQAAAARTAGEETKLAQVGRAQAEESDGDRARSVRAQADKSQAAGSEQPSDSSASTPPAARPESTIVESPAARAAAASAARAAAQESGDGASRGWLSGLWARYHVKTSVYYWIAGWVALAALLVKLIQYIRWRIEEANPRVQLRYAIGPTYQPAAEEPAKPSLTETLPMVRNSGSGSAASKLSAALKARKAAEPAHELEQHEVDPEHHEEPAEPQSGLDTWRTQTALLEQDILSETDVLPFVLDTDNQLKALDEESIPPEEFISAEELTTETPKVASTARTEKLPQISAGPTEKLPRIEIEGMEIEGMEVEEGAELELHDSAANDELINDRPAPDKSAQANRFAQAKAPGAAPKAPAQTTVQNTVDLPNERSTTNKEIVKDLESSLDYQPDRVDLQLKLLEIYHHEALDNRENFHSMLRKLSSLDPKQLSPAQRLHVEMLQRTLHDGDDDGDSDFAIEEEM